MQSAPEGEIVERFSWEEGYDWEFEFAIEIYRNGVLFKAGGDEQRGITTQTEFQTFDRPGGISRPEFMHTGGEYFLFERWLSEWNELSNGD